MNFAVKRYTLVIIFKTIHESSFTEIMKTYNTDQILIYFQN